VKISRADALNQGLKTYFTGKPCRRGHICDRYVCSYVCVDCGDLNGKSWASNNVAKVAQMRRTWRNRDIDRTHAIERASREKYPEKQKARAAKQSNAAKRAEWKRKNRARVLALVQKRKLELKNRVPKWANLQAISRIYEFRDWLSNVTGVQYHVDHEIPAFGKLVSGLHVEGNLQVIPAEANLRKNRSYEV
jgi:hypothetical protein